MREIKGDLWDYHKAGYWIGITTNGYVNSRGEAVMGKGIAKQAALKFPTIKKKLGSAIKTYGNNVLIFADIRLFTFPVKHTWREVANFDLIINSCYQLLGFLNNSEGGIEVALPQPGCGNGQLDWEIVKAVIEPILGDRVLIVDWSVV